MASAAGGAGVTGFGAGSPLGRSRQTPPGRAHLPLPALRAEHERLSGQVPRGTCAFSGMKSHRGELPFEKIHDAAFAAADGV